MSSLPKNYENFVIAIETRDSLPSISFLKQKLLEETERRKEKTEEEAECSQQAFNVRSTQKQKKQNNRRPFRGKCFNCNEEGHFVSQCDKKKKQQQQALSMLAAAEPRAKQHAWYVDSGATTHMCNDRNMFVRFENHHDQIMLVGNKFIIATGKGGVFFQFRYFDLTFQNVL